LNTHALLARMHLWSTGCDLHRSPPLHGYEQAYTPVYPVGYPIWFLRSDPLHRLGYRAQPLARAWAEASDGLVNRHSDQSAMTPGPMISPSDLPARPLHVVGVPVTQVLLFPSRGSKRVCGPRRGRPAALRTSVFRTTSTPQPACRARQPQLRSPLPLSDIAVVCLGGHSQLFPSGTSTRLRPGLTCPSPGDRYL